MKKKHIFAVLDTNVLVSALLTQRPDSPTTKLITALNQKAFTALYNTEIIEEYREVLNRRKFDLDPDVINGVINIVQDNGLFTGRTTTKETFKDKDDVVFYEVALSKEGAYVVTGNIKDFPQKPIVVTPAEMIAILENLELITKITNTTNKN